MDYSQRITLLQDYLKKQNLDNLLIDDPIDLFYLTGVSLSLGRIVITQNTARLFVDGRYFESCQKSSPVPTKLSDKNAFLKFLSSSQKGPMTLGFDSKYTSFSAFQALSELLSKNSQTDISLVPVESPLRDIRCIKESEEILSLKKAAKLGSRGFDYACTLLKENISEKEIATELEIFWKREGSDKIAFDINVSFGANSSMPHHRAGSSMLREGDTVLMDIGVTLNNYNSDMTRVVFFGRADPEILKIYNIVQKAQETALELCRPGMPIGELDKISRKVIEDAGYGKYYTHSLGHGIGLEVHEFPIIKSSAPYSESTLAAGMAITIEPGIYLPKRGGVRIEDTVVITEDSYENLTLRPKDPVVL
ncbi:MAG: Xaa-Pro aminopeptidase [Chlamydiales bacterium]|jgi:Xaa-Pro aminopeptidase